MATVSESEIVACLGRFPGPLELRPRPWKWIKVILIGVLFVALGIAFIVTPESFSNTRNGDRFASAVISMGLARDARQATLELGWVIAIFFGLACLTGIVSLLPGASSLVLDGDGFVVTNLFRRTDYRWRDVGDFAVVNVSYGRGRKKMVGLNHRPAAETRMGAINVKIIGRTGMLPDTYGFSPEDLAVFMVRWREQALARRKPPNALTG